MASMDQTMADRGSMSLAFIGGGLNSAVGRVHQIASQMDRRWTLVAGCFSSHTNVNADTADAWGVAPDRLYDDWRQLLDREKGRVDAVVVLSPTDNHEEHVLAALKAGHNVICEKALAMSASQIKRIEEMRLKSKRFLAVTYNYAGYPMIRELAARVHGGELGRITYVQAEMPQEGYLRVGAEGEVMKPQAWRLKDGLVPKVSLDLGVHLVHLVNWLVGDLPKEVVATGASSGHFPEVQDTVTALTRYSNGVDGQFWYGKSALGKSNGLKISLFGTQGSAHWVQTEPEELQLADQLGQRTILDRGTAGLKIASADRYTRFKAGHPAGFIEAFANCYVDWADGLQRFRNGDNTNSSLVSGTHEALQGLAFLEAVSTSISSRAWQEVSYG